MAGRKPKYGTQDWIDIARRMLVDEGISGLKVDRLADRLGAARSSFYYLFRDRDQLLGQLVRHWWETCRFLPGDPPPARAAEAMLWLDGAIVRMIESDGYDHRFDLAVRAWARSDKRIRWAVERADRERLQTLQKFFEAIGCSREQAAIRSRVYYHHQIGYYAIGVRESMSERRRNAERYLAILCGEATLAEARTGARTARRGKAA